MAFRIAKSGSSMNIKSYQLIVSIIGLSTLLAQILFSINRRSGTSSAARVSLGLATDAPRGEHDYRGAHGFLEPAP
jgi:hypothetical protein